MHTHTIEVRLHDVNKLFDAMDPSAFGSQDLHPNVVEHIEDAARALPRRTALSLLLYVDHPLAQSEDDAALTQAIHAYFLRQSKQARHRLRLHLRRGVISLIIGLSVLGAALVGARFLGEGTIASTLRESMDIGGWVALWRPMEMFLYDWWPIVGDQMLYRRLGRMPVRFQYAQSAH